MSLCTPRLVRPRLPNGNTAFEPDINIIKLHPGPRVLPDAITISGREYRVSYTDAQASDGSFGTVRMFRGPEGELVAVKTMTDVRVETMDVGKDSVDLFLLSDDPELENAYLMSTWEVFEERDREVVPMIVDAIPVPQVLVSDKQNREDPLMFPIDTRLTRRVSRGGERMVCLRLIVSETDEDFRKMRRMYDKYMKEKPELEDDIVVSLSVVMEPCDVFGVEDADIVDEEVRIQTMIDFYRQLSIVCIRKGLAYADVKRANLLRNHNKDVVFGDIGSFDYIGGDSVFATTTPFFLDLECPDEFDFDYFRVIDTKEPESMMMGLHTMVLLYDSLRSNSMFHIVSRKSTNRSEYILTILRVIMEKEPQEPDVRIFKDLMLDFFNMWRFRPDTPQSLRSLYVKSMGVFFSIPSILDKMTKEQWDEVRSIMTLTMPDSE